MESKHLLQKGGKKDEGDKMILFHEPVKEIKGPLADLIQASKKAEHHREFE